MPSGSQRLFFALWPSPAQQRALAAAVSDTMQSTGGRLIPCGNYHVTLAFLGSVAADRVAAVREVGAGVAVDFARGVASRDEVAAEDIRLDRSGSIRIELDRIEFWRRAGIACAVANAAPQVRGLYSSLHQALAAAGFVLDEKPFRPHVTLARKVARQAKDELARSSQCQLVRTVIWELDALALIDSRTLPAGSSYSSVQVWPLFGEARKRLEKKPE